jgi:restriction system protein
VSGWAGWLIPIACFLLIGISASLYLHRIRLPREESAAGVAALAGMRWRDFIHLVLAALIQRGYERVFEPQAAGQEGDYVLERGGQRFLLSSKHGAAYVLGSTAIAEFANVIRMRGAAGGLLVTPGQFAPEARPLARAQRIELLDGPTLWPELRPLLPAEQRAVVSAPSQARTRRQVILAWIGALVVSAAVFVLGHREGNIESPITTIPPKAIVSTPVKASARKAQKGVISAAPQPDDAALLLQHRTEVAATISTLPGIDRAIWETQSTLLVHLLDDQTDPLPMICPQLERYEALAATRLQLQPPQGSVRPVRFVQCRAY